MSPKGSCYGLPVLPKVVSKEDEEKAGRKHKGVWSWEAALQHLYFHPAEESLLFEISQRAKHVCFLTSAGVWLRGAISVSGAVHISFADLPALPARWPGTCVHMVSGNNNSAKMKNASHSLQTNGYSAIPGKLSQSRQLSGLKKNRVRKEFGGLESPDRKRVGTVTSKSRVDV